MDDFSWLYEKDSQESPFTCLLCPHRCRLKTGQTGFCKSRKAYEREIGPVHSSPVTVLALDPIEKKPFYHFLPGHSILSIGFSGCNLRCPFCQNWQIAQSDDYDTHNITPEDLPGLCGKQNSPGVAFTYSEPLIHFEYLINSAEILRKKRLLSLLVTNGFINSKPGHLLAERMDAVKVDLKGFNPKWYKKDLSGGLKPVLEFIETCASSTHLEVVTLVIPGKNDSSKEIKEAAQFLSQLNPDIPYHLTAYYPQYQYKIPPTSKETILRLADTAREDLRYVYTGNLGMENPTLCPECKATLIDRSYGQIRVIGLEKDSCTRCGHKIYGRF